MKVLRQMVHHPLTESGIVRFREDWQKAQASAVAPEPAAVATARG
jgi:hypothetical protein